MGKLPVMCVIGFCVLHITFSDPVLFTPTALEAELRENFTFFINILTIDNKSDLTVKRVINGTTVGTVIAITDGSYNVSDIWKSRAKISWSRDHSTYTSKLTISLIPVVFEDEGLYVVRVSGSEGEDVTQFPFRTFAKPQGLQLQTTSDSNLSEGTVVEFICSGNVGRPQPVIRLSIFDKLNPNRTYGLQAAKVGTQQGDGTFQVDHMFRHTITSSDNGVNFICEMYYDVALSQYIPTVKSGFLSFQVLASGQQNARLIAPNQFILGQDELTIDCRPEASAYSTIYAITIKRNTSTTTDNKVVTVSLDGGTSVVWQDTSVENRVSSIISNITAPSNAQMKYVIPGAETQCSDAATYTCDVNGVNSGTIVGNNVVTKYVSVTVKPTKMDPMTSSPPPQFAGNYNKDTNITFSCTGTIGDYNPYLEIRWCIKRSTDTDFTPVSVEGSVVQNAVVSDGACQNKRSSTLVYTVVQQDTDTQILCQITAPGDATECGLGTIKDSKDITTGQSVTPQTPGGQGDGSDVTSSAGIIAGSVLGSIAVIILIVLIVYFVCVRKRSPGESYKTREDTDGKENPEGPVYSVPDKNRRVPENGVPVRQHSQPPKAELHYADLDIASNPPARPKSQPDRGPPTEYASMEGSENAAVTEQHTKPRGARRNLHDKDRYENSDRHRDGRGYDNPSMDGYHDRDGTPEPRNSMPGGPMGSAV